MVAVLRLLTTVSQGRDAGTCSPNICSIYETWPWKRTKSPRRNRWPSVSTSSHHLYGNLGIRHCSWWPSSQGCWEVVWVTKRTKAATGQRTQVHLLHFNLKSFDNDWDFGLRWIHPDRYLSTSRKLASVLLGWASQHSRV